MRINLGEEPMLSVYYGGFKEYKAEGERWVKNTFVDRAYNEGEMIRYARSNGLFDEVLDKSSASYNIVLAEYYRHLQKVHGAVFRRGLNVEIVSQSFYETALQNSKTLVSSTQNKGYFELLGECSGLLLFPEIIVEYSVAEDGSFFNSIPRHHLNTDKSDDFGLKRFFGDETLNLSSSLDETSSAYHALVAAVAVLILKKYGEVETQIIGCGARRKELNSDDYILNKAPFKITQLDSSWLRTIIRTEGFLVRGHFRLQACGKGLADRKLIYIEPFEKHGYTRTARKVVSERKN